MLCGVVLCMAPRTVRQRCSLRLCGGATVTSAMMPEKGAAGGVILVGGCFALPGSAHFSLFRLLKETFPQYRLVVAVNGNRRTSELKPYHVLTLEERLTMLRGCRWVDDVLVFEEDTPADVIRRIKPAVYVKGEEWRDELFRRDEAGRYIYEDAAACEEVRAQVFFAPSQGRHTSEILRHILAQLAGQAYTPRQRVHQSCRE